MSGDTAKKIGPYKILSVLGKGSMGAVYKVQHPKENTVLAAKVLLQHKDRAEENVKRFYQEIELVSELQYPNIIKIHSVGSHDGFPFYVMDYIEGQTLNKFLKKESPLEERRALKMMEKIAGALACAHKKDIVHRDLKPANIIIDKDEIPYLTDFGIAKCKDGMYKKLTPAGFVVGTPLYMAPEQANGKRNLVGCHSDVYALGTNLYTMLADQPPFIGRSPMKVMDMVINEEPIPVCDLNSEISEETGKLVAKAMAKSIQQRYPNAQEFVNDIRNILAGRPIATVQAPVKTENHNFIYISLIVLLVLVCYLLFEYLPL